MRFKVSKLHDSGNEAILDLEPLPGERILVGEKFVICAKGDPILSHGHRLRMGASLQIYEGYDETSVVYPGRGLTVFKNGIFDMLVIFDATSEALAAQLKQVDLDSVNVEVDLTGYEALDCDPSTFEFVVIGDGPGIVEYLQVKSIVVDVAQPALEAA